MTLANKFRYAFVFWPFALVIGWIAYASSINIPCFSPNLTLYRYCDVHAAGSPNLILGTILIVLGAWGWIIATFWILPKDEV